MKKKIGLSLFAVLFIAIATMGTIAYFSKSFTSDKNTATAASFEVEAVNASGTVIGDAEFNLDGKLYPGMKTIEAYTFQINKNKTEVPVEYKVNVTPSGELFPEDGTTPIFISLQRNVNGAWENIDLSSTFKPESDTESFKILINWPHGDNDIAFQGMSGNIKLDVVATQIDDEVEPTEPEPEPEDPNAEKGNAHIAFFKDSATNSNSVEFANITSFKLKNKKTRREYTVGTTPWNQKHVYQMKDIPVGEYTIHFTPPAGMSVHQILQGDAYKETLYHPDTNPYVIMKRDKGMSNYVSIVLKSELILKEIKPLADLKVPSNITLQEFLAALPKQTTIVDSSNQKHQVDVKWDIRPFNFENWKKPGEVKIRSEFFKLPLSVSNTDPATRLEVTLNVVFE